MNNPFSGKWAIIVYRFNSNLGPDRCFGLLEEHSKLKCDNEDCWLDNGYNDAKLFNTKEEAILYCNTTDSKFATYLPIQIP